MTSDKQPPIWCDVCGKRIVRRKDNFTEQWGPRPEDNYARHHDCRTFEAKVVLVEKRK